MRKLALGCLIFASAACRATLPTTVHNPTASGFAGELGPLYGFNVEDDAKEVTTDEKDKLKTQDGAGFLALLQTGPFYAKVDAAPLPGMWLGLGMTDPKPGKLAWYPAIEFTGSSDDGGSSEESKDGFLEDDAGNRYLYEIKRTRSGFGVALPQLVEFYPIKKLGTYIAATPTFLNDRAETEVELVYERERRIVKADPALDAEFQDIVTYEQRNDKNINRWLLPLSAGLRFQIKSFHARLAYVTRRVDSVKDYENAFRDVVLLTVGYVATGPAASSSARSSRPSPASRPEPAPQPSSSTTTTTTTTGPGGTTTTTTTTSPPPAQTPPRRP